MTSTKQIALQKVTFTSGAPEVHIYADSVLVGKYYELARGGDRIDPEGLAWVDLCDQTWLYAACAARLAAA